MNQLVSTLCQKVKIMPRKAPDQVQEMRITFGNYERQFVTGIKEDIETAAKVTAAASIAVPVITGVAVAGGLGMLGYGIYRGLDGFSFGLAKPIKDKWEDVKDWINPTKEWSVDEMDRVQASHTWMHNRQRELWIYSGGFLGHEDWDALQESKKNGGGDL